jgi:serine phosphatase RsbU (regulator of sigma subunit)
MDISLFCLSEVSLPDGEGTRTKLDWAGANNPLWIIRNEECIEYKPDKRPISFSRGQELLFTNHSIELQKGDALYIFTDGFADQFGGEKGKKFKYKQLQQVLLSMQHEPMQRQEEILLQTFMKWKRSLEQVDDVLVIGVKI